MARDKEKLPDIYWWFFSSNVEDWHKNNNQRDKDRWNKIYRDKKEREHLRRPNLFN